MSLDVNGFPKIVDGVEISGELTETTGWVPEGAWAPMSIYELDAIARFGRVARVRAEDLRGIISLFSDSGTPE